MSDNVWHEQWKRSWWDGTVTAWCGQTYRSGAYETDLLRLGTWPKCPACRAAKKRAR